jgi:hypothetical protein
MIAAQLPNDRWSVDFAADQFIDGRRMRIFVVVDMARMRFAPKRKALRMANWPTGPQPQIATVSPPLKLQKSAAMYHS